MHIQFLELGLAEFASFDHLNLSHVETGATTMKDENRGFGLDITNTM